nr:hypothetical protein [bacterium]
VFSGGLRVLLPQGDRSVLSRGRIRLRGVSPSRLLAGLTGSTLLGPGRADVVIAGGETAPVHGKPCLVMDFRCPELEVAGWDRLREARGSVQVRGRRIRIAEARAEFMGGTIECRGLLRPPRGKLWLDGAGIDAGRFLGFLLAGNDSSLRLEGKAGFAVCLLWPGSGRPPAARGRFEIGRGSLAGLPGLDRLARLLGKGEVGSIPFLSLGGAFEVSGRQLRLEGVSLRSRRFVLTVDGALELSSAGRIDLRIGFHVQQSLARRLGRDLRDLLVESSLGGGYREFDFRVWGRRGRLRDDIVGRLASRAAEQWIREQGSALDDAAVRETVRQGVGILLQHFLEK